MARSNNPQLYIIEVSRNLGGLSHWYSFHIPALTYNPYVDKPNVSCVFRVFAQTREAAIGKLLETLAGFDHKDDVRLIKGGNPPVKGAKEVLLKPRKPPRIRDEDLLP